MAINDIYSKFCNDIMNPALGAYALSTFVKSYNETSEQGNANILLAFIILPMLMNESIRNIIITDNYKKQKKILGSVIEGLCTDDKVFGTLHDNIVNYREYTLISLIFALRIGLLEIRESEELIANNDSIYPNPNIIVVAGEMLGKLFAKGSLQNFISYTGVQI